VSLHLSVDPAEGREEGRERVAKRSRARPRAKRAGWLIRLVMRRLGAPSPETIRGLNQVGDLDTLERRATPSSRHPPGTAPQTAPSEREPAALPSVPGFARTS